MRRKKCLATLTMAAMVAASLAGCGSSGEKTDNSQAAVSGETTVSDSGEKKKDSGSATVVSMWHMSVSYTHLILKDISGNEVFAMHTVRIVSIDGNVKKEYHQDGYYVTGVSISDGLLELDRVVRQENG